MPTQKIFPVDKLGCDIKVGDYIDMDLPDNHVQFFVNSIEPATVIIDKGNAIPCDGHMEIVVKYTIPYRPDNPRFFKALALKAEPPKESRLIIQ